MLLLFGIFAFKQADSAVQHNHVINWKDAKVLQKECDTGARHIKESQWIRKRTPNTMNRDEGVYYLRRVYDPLLATSEPSADQSSRSRGEKMDQYPSSL